MSKKNETNGAALEPANGQPVNRLPAEQPAAPDAELMALYGEYLAKRRIRVKAVLGDRTHRLTLDGFPARGFSPADIDALTAGGAKVRVSGSDGTLPVDGGGLLGPAAALDALHKLRAAVRASRS